MPSATPLWGSYHPALSLSAPRPEILKGRDEVLPICAPCPAQSQLEQLGEVYLQKALWPWPWREFISHYPLTNHHWGHSKDQDDPISDLSSSLLDGESNNDIPVWSERLGHTVLWESREAGGTSPEEAGGLPRGGGLWAEAQSMHRRQPGQGYSWQRLQPGRGLRLSWGTEYASRMCNGWAIGPLIALKAGHRDLGGVRWHADSRWNVTCFCFTENSLSLGLGLRVFFGNPRTGWGLVCLSQSRMEREDRWGQEVTWAQIVPEAQCPFGVWWVQSAGFLHLSLTGINHLRCPEKLPDLSSGFNC